MARRSQALDRFQAYASIAVDTFLFGMVRPYLFILVINDRCNLDCFYCKTKNTGKYDLDYDTVRSCLLDARQRGHRALVITGGEPTLWQSGEARLANVIDFARESGFVDIAVYTNGTHPIDADEATFIVTIDGTKETHDVVRSGSYDRILENSKRARAKVIASMTLSKANVEVLESAVERIASSGAFAGITFNLLTGEPEVVAKYGFVGEERRRVLQRIWAMKERGYPIFYSRAAHSALMKNNWKRPIKQIELFAGKRLFACCRDVENPEICRNCGYTSCAEIAQALAGRPSALLQLLRAK